MILTVEHNFFIIIEVKNIVYLLGILLDPSISKV